MALIIDISSKKITAEIKINKKIERYDCRFSACESPVCTCGVVYLNLTELQPENQPKKSLVPRKIDIDIHERTLGYSQEEKISKEDLEFAEQVLNNLNDDDFEILADIHFKFKNKISEQASPDSIDAIFDFEEVEYNGLMSFYNDVLPYGDRLVILVEGKKYDIQDQYCLLPKCSCTDANLGFELRNTKGEPKDYFGAALVNYNKKRWEVTDNIPSFASIGTIKSAVEQQIPDIYTLLLQRHLKLKSIYAHCKKRDYAPKEETQLPLPQVGRNEPCPCGSGKKYKKCCLMKSK